MKNFLRVSVMIFCVSLSLVACDHNPKKTTLADSGDSCKMSYKTQGGWKIAGIEIPGGKLAPGQTVKIGSVEYGSAQVDKLSETAQFLEQIRLMNCAVLAANPSWGGDAVKKGYDIVLAFIGGLKTATTPQQGVAAAEKAQADAKQVAAETTQPPSAPNSTPSEQPAPKSSSVDTIDPLQVLTQLANSTSLESMAHGQRINMIQENLDALNKRVQALQSSPQRSVIDVIGFAETGTSMPASARESVYEKFDAALTSIPSNSEARVLIIGYADKSGSYLKNVDLGLRRAEAVLETLQRRTFSRAFQPQVVSGGISNSVRGRHVMIYVDA